MRMPFGKHRGEKLADIDIGYLEWLFENCDLRAPLRSAVKAELDRRQWDQSPDPLCSTTITTDIVNTWHRRMAVKFHPDKGGSHEVMKAVNFGRDVLLSLIDEVTV